jgi:hypothetical protein
MPEDRALAAIFSILQRHIDLSNRRVGFVIFSITLRFINSLRDPENNLPVIPEGGVLVLVHDLQDNVDIVIPPGNVQFIAHTGQNHQARAPFVRLAGNRCHQAYQYKQDKEIFHHE